MKVHDGPYLGSHEVVEKASVVVFFALRRLLEAGLEVWLGEVERLAASEGGKAQGDGCKCEVLHRAHHGVLSASCLY